MVAHQLALAAHNVLVANQLLLPVTILQVHRHTPIVTPARQGIQLHLVLVQTAIQQPQKLVPAVQLPELVTNVTLLRHILIVTHVRQDIRVPLVVPATPKKEQRQKNALAVQLPELVTSARKMLLRL